MELPPRPRVSEPFKLEQFFFPLKGAIVWSQWEVFRQISGTRRLFEAGLTESIINAALDMRRTTFFSRRFVKEKAKNRKIKKREITSSWFPLKSTKTLSVWGFFEVLVADMLDVWPFLNNETFRDISCDKWRAQVIKEQKKNRYSYIKNQFWSLCWTGKWYIAFSLNSNSSFQNHHWV